jgi:small Trp-rich protein
MYFVVAGVLLLVMKWAEFGPAAAWSWGWILAPFALAIAWWAWADSSGYTQRKAAEKDQERKDMRREKNMESLGLKDRKRRP